VDTKGHHSIANPPLHPPVEASWNQNDLTESAALQNFFMGAGSLGEGQLLLHNRPQRTFFEPGHATATGNWSLIFSIFNEPGDLQRQHFASAVLVEVGIENPGP
jgi:hypothetical protein